MSKAPHYPDLAAMLAGFFVRNAASQRRRDADSVLGGYEQRPSDLPPRNGIREYLALFMLALGGFAIGCSEFGAMGLLPQIARSLLPEAYSANSESATGTAGAVVALYALGVVVGAPTVGIIASRMAPKLLLLSLLAAMSLGTALTAVAPTFGLVLAARVVSGLPHSVFCGVASVVASSLLGGNSRAKGAAFVLGGLTIASVIGVPVITWLGQAAGWRISYVLIAALFAVALLGVSLMLPRESKANGAAATQPEFSLRNRRFWIMMIVGATSGAAMFAVITFAAPLATEYNPASAPFAPLALLAVGIGMTIGNYLGGWLGDISVARAYSVTYIVGAAGLLTLLLAGRTDAGSLIGLSLVGAAVGGLSPAVQVTLMDSMSSNPTLAASFNSACLNSGSALGAYLAGTAIIVGLGYAGALWIGLVLLTIGIFLALCTGIFTYAKHAAPNLNDD